MSTYRQLLLSTGGGVISESQQDEQNNCATIAIGLGGTGVACLRNLKKQIYSRLQPDDPESPIPQYSHIKFLAVDTDKRSLEADGAFNSLDEHTEFFDISTADIHGLLKQTKTLYNSPECHWLKTEDVEEGQKGLAILAADAGAGGVRQIGRLLMIEKSAEFVSKMVSLIEEVKRSLDGQGELTIHIFSGMGGGTGSGTFLDVCYLIQYALEQVGLDGEALTCGYFFLPDVNLSKPNIGNNNAISKIIKVNGFSAMKEFDYCMNFENNHGKWEQEYKGFRIGPTQETPVKVCHLISAHDVTGQVLNDGYNYAMNVVSDFIMQFLVKPAVSQNGKTTLSMKSHISNYSSIVQKVSKESGANYHYCILGASNAIVPMREIATYLASKLFEEMANGSRRKPTDQEVDVFAENNGLTYKHIQDSLLSQTNYRMPSIASDLDYKDFLNMDEADKRLPDEIILPKEIMEPYRNRFQAAMVNQITTNYHAMINPWSLNVIQKSQESVSKVIATFFALRNLVIDPEFGPFYAADVLNGAQTKNLVNHLRGVQKQVEHDLNSVRGDLTLRIQAVKRTRGEFLHGGLFANKKKNFEDFITSVAAYYTTTSYIKVLEQMQALMPVMIKQFISLYDEHFKIYQTVNHDLIDTFHENYQTLSSANLTSTIADPFVLPLMQISQMKNSLDAVVGAMKLDAQAHNFQSFLFDNPQVWNTVDENKISKEVSKYFVDVFKDYTGKTITNYLEDRFGTNNAVKLTDNVYTEIMMPLKAKAEALFWKGAGRDHVIASAQPIGYISVPDSATVIMSASGRLAKDYPEFQECPSKMKDRIFLLKCLCGVPMFAYNGINAYFNEYRNDHNIGNHLYELTKLDKRDWRTLPDLQPFSVNIQPTEEIINRSKDYDRAVELGIVRPSPSAQMDYQIIIRPEIDEIVENSENALSAMTYEKVRDALASIDEFKKNREIIKIIAISNDGIQGHEEQVRKDHVLDSKEMSDAIHNEVIKEDKLVELFSRLENAKRTIDSSRLEKDNFFKALYSGIITVNIPKVIYNEEDCGMVVDEVVLSEPSMAPAGGVAPLYQAYLTFKGMPAEEKDKLNSMTLSRLNDGNYKDILQDSCDRLLKTFNNAYLAAMQNQARSSLREKEKEIVNFLLEFRRGIDNFKAMYGLA